MKLLYHFRDMHDYRYSNISFEFTRDNVNYYTEISLKNNIYSILHGTIDNQILDSDLNFNEIFCYIREFYLYNIKNVKLF